MKSYINLFVFVRLSLLFLGWYDLAPLLKQKKKTHPYLSSEKRVRIYALLQEGHSTRVVAHREKVSQPTVIRVRNNKDATGSFENRPKSGRPRVVSVHDERKMLQLIVSGQCHTAMDVQVTLKTQDKLEISAQTICRTFQRNGLESRIRRKKPLTTSELHPKT